MSNSPINRLEKAEAIINAMNLQIKDVMSTDVVTLVEDQTMQNLEDVLDWERIRHVPVVDQAGKPIGIVTHRDLLKYSISAFCENSEEVRSSLKSQIPISELMSYEVTTVKPELNLRSAAHKMLELKIGCLLVVDSVGVLIGIVTEADFVKFFGDGLQ